MKKTKILYIITQGHWGGAQKYVFDLASSLPNDFDITVALGDSGNSPDLQKRLENNTNLKLVNLKHLVRPISPINDLLAIFELRKLYTQFKPDIIHLNSSKAGILGSLATYNLQAKTYKLIYTVHGWVFNEPMSQWKKRLYIYLEKATAKIKTKIIVLSDKEKKTGVNILHIPDNKLTIIPVGIDNPINTLTKSEAREKLKKYLPNIPTNEWQNTYIIGTIANFYSSKNLDNLVNSAVKIRQNIKDFHIIIIGDGEERKKLENLIVKNNLNQNVHLLGFLDNASQFLPAFDVFVLSSKKEGLPYSVLEAKSQNIPVISTDVGSISEIIENQKTGLVIPSENTEKLSDAIIFAHDNPDIMRQMAQNAFNSKLFTRENTVKQIISLYRSLLE